MRNKTVPVISCKAGPQDGLEEGQFEAFVAVFGNKDYYGDVILPDAFNDTLTDWEQRGRPIPVIWSHGYGDVLNHVGVVLKAEPRTINGKSGLWVKGQVDISDDPEDAQARKTWKLLKGKRVSDFSFTYDVVDGAYVKSEELGEYYELRKVRLYEVGPTLIGANPQTELLDAKAIQALAVEVKAGRTISAKNEQLLRTAHDSIGEVLSALDSNDGKATANAPAKDDEPDGAKSEEPTRTTPAPMSALKAIELQLAVLGD